MYAIPVFYKYLSGNSIIREGKRETESIFVVVFFCILFFFNAYVFIFLNFFLKYTNINKTKTKKQVFKFEPLHDSFYFINSNLNTHKKGKIEKTKLTSKCNNNNNQLIKKNKIDF
jgi:hypothetical protein